MRIVSFDEVNIDAGPHGYGCFDEASIAFRLSAVHYCSLFHACSLTHIRQDGACITHDMHCIAISPAPPAKVSTEHNVLTCPPLSALSPAHTDEYAPETLALNQGDPYLFSVHPMVRAGWGGAWGLGSGLWAVGLGLRAGLRLSWDGVGVEG